MPVAVSSLSVAVQGVADYLNGQFDEDVLVSVNTPQRASEIQKGGNQAAHCLNIFVYRVAPSGFHADAGADETQFIRINALLTPFPDEGETEAEDSDLRILGHAIRVLQANPILPMTSPGQPPEPPLPGPAITEPPGRKDYRLQSILLAPPVEEINHIWTTQGGELAYRLSAAYEFALIPIEPLVERVVADPPHTAVLGVNPNAVQTTLAPLNDNSRAIPLSGAVLGTPPPANWLPIQMLVDGETLTSALTIAQSTTEIDIALAGPEGEEASVEVVWTQNDDTETAQAPQILTIATPLIDAEEARATVTLAIPADAATGILRTRAATGGAAIPGTTTTNVLTLTVS